VTDDASTDSDDAGTDFHENLIENSFDYWFDSELERRDLSRDDFEKGKVLFKTPFASQQMDELKAGEGDTEVYVNDDADVIFLVSLDADRDIQEGDEIYFDEIGSLDDVYIKPEEADYGYFILAKLPDGSYTYAFDFRRNRQYQNEMIEAAEEFIRAAEDALSREDWRVFIENAFQASEKILKLPALFNRYTQVDSLDFSVRCPV